MPSHITHTKSYMDVYALLPGRIQKQYSETWEQYKIFAQGHDFLLLYMFLHLPSYPKIHAKLKIVEEDIQELAVQYITTLQKTNKTPESMLFLYGYLIHHFLDAKLHPLIVYKTGDLRNDKNASALHLLVENMIDAYMLRRDGIDPRKYEIHALVTSDEPMTTETRSIIDLSFEKTYGLENFSALVANYNKMTRTFLKALRYDPSGIKKRLFKPLDYLLMGLFKPSVLPFHFDGTECIEYLNTQNEPWAFPADAARVSTQSFDELYADGIVEIARMISILDEAISEHAAEPALRSIIPNVSSISGIERHLPVDPNPPAPLAVSSSASDHA